MDGSAGRVHLRRPRTLRGREAEGDLRAREVGRRSAPPHRSREYGEKTEGGEALTFSADVAVGAGAPGAPLAIPPPPWHILWTRSHCEQSVSDQLVAAGFDPFLPR